MATDLLMACNPPGFPGVSDWSQLGFNDAQANDAFANGVRSSDIFTGTTAPIDPQLDLSANASGNLFGDQYHQSLDQGVQPSDIVASESGSAVERGSSSFDAASIDDARASFQSLQAEDDSPSREKTTRKSKRQTQAPKKPDSKANSNAGAAKRPRKTSKSSSSTSSVGSGSGSQRNKCLERNRIAASKCRQKKKEWMHDLEGTKTELEAQHMALQVEVGRLQDEVTMIKELLTAHADCNDPNIGRWIETEAARFVRKSIGSADSYRQAASSSVSPTHSSTDATSISPHSPPIKNENNFNYDFMPDDMFNDEIGGCVY